MDAVDAVDKHISFATVLIRTFAEFAAVLFQLVCFSRLGTRDYYYLVNHKAEFAEYDNSQLEPSLAANFVLFVTLVVFQFPFMNAYILFMYDMCVIAHTSWWRILCCFWLLGVQIVGVLMAWRVIRDVQMRWKGTLTWIVPAFQATDTGISMEAEFYEEFLAVLALLVGYIHLTYLNFGKLGLFRSPEHLFSELSPQVLAIPIPMTFIMQMTLLVAGLLSAFPTSHLSPHISCYLLSMGYTTWARFYFRLLGGGAAFIVTYCLFWLGYAPRVGVHPFPKWRPIRQDAGEYSQIPTAASGKPGSYNNPVKMQLAAISFHNAYRHMYAT
jgi:hypothetical protein